MLHALNRSSIICTPRLIILLCPIARVGKYCPTKQMSILSPLAVLKLGLKHTTQTFPAQTIWRAFSYNCTPSNMPTIMTPICWPYWSPIPICWPSRPPIPTMHRCVLSYSKVFMVVCINCNCNLHIWERLFAALALLATPFNSAVIFTALCVHPKNKCLTQE